MKAVIVFCVCFVYIELTLSRPLVDQSTAQELDQTVRLKGMSAYALYLSMELAIASSGKNFVKQSEAPTEDCMRTAKVTQNLFTKPSTCLKTSKMVYWAVSRTFRENSTQNPVNTLCKNLNLATRKSQYRIADFEELKSQVELPKPAKNFVVEIPQGTNVAEFTQKPFAVDDPEFIKQTLMLFFLAMDDKTTEAILTLSKRDAIKSVVDSDFIRARDDYLRELSNKTRPFTETHGFEDFSKKVDQYFTNNSTLKEEYKKLIDC